MATDNAANSPPYRILVRVSENFFEMEKKLQKYFQNPWKSRGGKCKVKAGPTEDTFWVDFYKRQAKEGVIAKRDHSINISDSNDTSSHVDIFIETNEKPEEKNTLETSQIFSQIQSVPQEFPDEKHSEEEVATSSYDFFIQKIFFHVEAQLTFKLSIELRQLIINLCPDIQIEGGRYGPERLIGDYEDIGKIYQFLREKMLGNDKKKKLSCSASAEEIEETEEIEEIIRNDCNSLVLYSSPKQRLEDELDLISVPAHLFEYFKYVFADTLGRIETENQVQIKSAFSCPIGNVYLDFKTSKSWDRQLAQDAFTRAFQREIQNVSHQDVHFPDNKLVLEMQKSLTQTFHNIHVKAEEKDLILWGNPKDILEAQHFIEENFAQKQPEEETMVYPNLKNGIEVETSLWRLLGQEIREIEKTYYTVMELVNKPKTGKTLIVFKPKDKDLDLSAHAYEDFIDLFQMLLPQIIKEVVILKPIDQKKKARIEKALFENLERKHSHVNIEWNKPELTLTGLPKYLEKAMKYIKRYYKIEHPPQQRQFSLPWRELE